VICCLFQESYRQLEAKEEQVKCVLMAAEDIVAQSSEANTVDLREKMEQLTKDVLAVRLKADKEKVEHSFLLGLYSLNVLQTIIILID